MELALDALRSVSFAVPVLEFQSLFSWNLLLMPAKEYSAWACNIVFQSLFSWNLLLMSPPGLLIISSRGVSILVFVELALDATPNTPFSVSVHVSILVFVELALDVMGLSCAMTTHACFNPCFRGTCS